MASSASSASFPSFFSSEQGVFSQPLNHQIRGIMPLGVRYTGAVGTLDGRVRLPGQARGIQCRWCDHFSLPITPPFSLLHCLFSQSLFRPQANEAAQSAPDNSGSWGIIRVRAVRPTRQTNTKDQKRCQSVPRTPRVIRNKAWSTYTRRSYVGSCVW